MKLTLNTFNLGLCRVNSVRVCECVQLNVCVCVCMCLYVVKDVYTCLRKQELTTKNPIKMHPKKY